jgi:hypothetical protein
MKKHLIGWDLRRIIYLLGGLFFVALAVKDQVWWMGLIGIYYAGMAIFKLGCASGNCVAPLAEKK